MSRSRARDHQALQAVAGQWQRQQQHLATKVMLA